MASVLDVAGLVFFLPVFIFILIFTLLLGLLEKTELLGKNKVLNITAAFCIAAVSVFAGKLTGLISEVVPWIVFVFILMALIFAIYGFFGVANKDIWELFGEPLPFILILVIVIIGISVVFESSLSPYQAGANVTAAAVTGAGYGALNPRTEMIRTITHPRLLGALFIMITAASTIHFLTKKIEGD